jgi:hypothetical protein
VEFMVNNVGMSDFFPSTTVVPSNFYSVNLCTVFITVLSTLKYRY